MNEPERIDKSTKSLRAVVCQRPRRNGSGVEDPLGFFVREWTFRKDFVRAACRGFRCRKPRPSRCSDLGPSKIFDDLSHDGFRCATASGNMEIPARVFALALIFRRTGFHAPVPLF